MKADRISRQWDDLAPQWAESVRDGLDLINERFGVPSFLERLSDIRGLDTLDAGCGEGRSARHLARAGARVTGVDVSAAMIREALREEQQHPLGIDYAVASCADLGHLPADRFDLATSFMALMDTPDLSQVLQALHRVLKVDGRLAIMVRHPCFFTSGLSFQRTANGERTRITVSDYFRGTPYRESWAFAGQSQQRYEVTRFPYTLSDYVSGLLSASFEICSIEEPRPTENAAAELPNLRFWQRHAALYLLIIARKRATSA